RARASVRARSVCAASAADAIPATTATIVGKDARRSEDRLAIDIRWYRHAEVLQHGRRDIDDVQVAVRQGPVRDDGAGGALVVERPVIAGPLLHVRIHEAGRRAAKR